MVEFKVVVSDPDAGKARVVPVIAVGSSDLKYGTEEKSGKVFPLIVVSKSVFDKLQAPYGIVTLRVWKDRSKNEKVKFTFRVKVDPNASGNEVYVPRDLLAEKLGVNRVYGELFRAKAFQVVVDGDRARRLVGLKIGDTVDASIIGIPGKLLKITGGSDNSGFPMIPTIPGPGKKVVLLSSPPGFHPTEDGERRRKIVRGNTISEELVQINTALVSPPIKVA